MIGLLVVLATVFLIYRQFSLRKPTQSLIAFLPENPIFFAGAKNLTDTAEAFGRSSFGQRAAQMPILTEIQRQTWWKQIVHQKRLWEHEMGRKIDFNKLKGYFGEEAILALYRREGEFSFLLITAVDAKEKLEIAAVTAADAFNPSYKRLQKDYSGFTINTITGYPRDFSYAFIGKIGLLTLSQSLIKETIDIYAEKRMGFIDRYPARQSLQKRYNSDGSTIFVHLPKLLDAFEPADNLAPLLEGMETWTFSNRYRNGAIRSHHRIQREPNQERQLVEPATINPMLLSTLPRSSAVSYSDGRLNPSTLWKLVKAKLPLQHQPGEINLTRHLGEEITITLVNLTSRSAIKMPSVIAAIPVTNRAGLEADLTRLRKGRIVVNGKRLQFSDSQTYRGVTFQPVQLPLGILFSLKGAYAFINDYWIVCTTISGMKSVIDTSTGGSTTLAEIQFPGPANEPRDGHLLIQPNLLISEFRSYMPILGLMAPLMGNTVDLRLTRRVIANSTPLETLGPMSAGVEFDEGGMNLDVQVVIPANEGF